MNFWYELNYTLRVIKNKLGFSLLCVVVIALGYIITMPLYSFVKNFAYGSLSYADSDRLVVIQQTNTRANFDYDENSFDAYQFDVLQQTAESFESLSSYREVVSTLSDGEFAKQFFGVQISTQGLSYSDPLPLFGRIFDVGDEIAGAEKVVMLSYEVWQNYYSADPDIIGKFARVSGVNHTIISVMPAGYKFPKVAELWLPATNFIVSEPGGAFDLAAVGKLSDGVSKSQAALEVASIMKRLASEYPDFYVDRSARIIPFTQIAISNALPLFNSIGGLAFCIYLLICLNVGNLLILRANERIGELAIRNAVGANRRTVIAHVLLESFIICFSGAVVGMLAAGWVLEFLQFFMLNILQSGRQLAFWVDFTFNWETLQLAIIMISALWLLSGSFAAWRVSRGDIVTIISGESKGQLSVAGGRITKSIVTMQLVLSFFLLVVSTSYLLDLRNSYETSVVEEPATYISSLVSLTTTTYEGEISRDRYRLELKQQLESVDEFHEVSFSSAMPGGVSFGIEASAELTIDSGEQNLPRFGQNWLSPGYLQSLEVGLVAGREFFSIEMGPVVIVDEAAAVRLGLEGAAVGSQIVLRQTDGQDSKIVTIVGVVPYIGEVDVNSGAARFPTISLPMNQQAPREFRILIKLADSSTSSIADIEKLIRLAVTKIDRDVALYEIERLSTPIERNNSVTRLMMSMFGSAALGAVVLSVIGVYGLISRAILARQAEVGIRRALGSSDKAILSMFIGQGFFYLVLAIIFGGAASVFVLDLVQSSASSMSSTNIYASLSKVLLGSSFFVALLVFFASYIPTRKVISMEPGEALHYD